MFPENIHISTWEISENLFASFVRRYAQRFLWVLNERRGGTKKKNRS